MAAEAIARNVDTSIDGLLDVQLLATAHGLLLMAYRSIHVKVDGYLYAPVVAFLSDFPHTLVSSEEKEDTAMCGGRGIRDMYRIGGVIPSKANAA
ncbi:hypothetical protein ACF1BU_34995 [Streptomyces sp. NPDC014724]|uniref:hypothetical protein n=1 Tax=Streptomyces sp. NPDC014724 TaxID=3364882 RepID=UPI003703070E